MSYKVICNVCGLLGKRSYVGNAEKIADRHTSKKKYSNHKVEVVYFNALIEALKRS